MKRDNNERAGRRGGTSPGAGFTGTHVPVARDGAGRPGVAGKIRPDGVVPQVTGAVFHCNDAAVGRTFGEKRGKDTGKPDSGDTIITEKEGPTITCNDPALTQPNADVFPRITKQLAQDVSTFRPLETAGELTASQSGSGGPTDHPYFLEKSYDKPGAKSRIGNRVKPFEGA